MALKYSQLSVNSLCSFSRADVCSDQSICGERERYIMCCYSYCELLCCLHMECGWNAVVMVIVCVCVCVDDETDKVTLLTRCTCESSEKRSLLSGNCSTISSTTCSSSEARWTVSLTSGTRLKYSKLNASNYNK